MGCPYQGTTCPFQQRVVDLTDCERFTQVINSSFSFSGIVVLSQHASHWLIHHRHVQDERPPRHRWHKYWRVHKALFDLSKCLLTVIVLANGLVLEQKFNEQLIGSSKLWYEPCYVVQTPQETSDLLLRSRPRHVKDGFYLVGIHFYPSLTYNQTK